MTTATKTTAAELPPVRSEPLLDDWIKKIQLVNRRSEHFNSVIETFCTEALSTNDKAQFREERA